MSMQRLYQIVQINCQPAVLVRIMVCVCMYVRMQMCMYVCACIIMCVHACLGVYMHVDVHVYTRDSGQYPLIRLMHASGCNGRGGDSQ